MLKKKTSHLYYWSWKAEVSVTQGHTFEEMMTNRRCLNFLSRHCQYVFSSNPSLQTLRTLPHLHTLFPSEPLSLENPTSNTHQIRRAFKTLSRVHLESIRSFSSGRRGSGKSDDDDQDEYDEDGEVDEDDEDDEEDEDGEVGESSDGDGEGNDVPVSNCVVGRYYSLEEKEREAAAIGYKVIGPLNPSERPFKPWEPVFAVVQIGSHQFKVSNGDCIFTERLKFCEVNDKLVLNRVLMLGSKTQTIIGRPTLPDAAVHAVVEEHALDAKVIIFKKKRRKNYRRTKGHRQELTKLRITDIQGIQKPEKAKLEEPEKEEIAA